MNKYIEICGDDYHCRNTLRSYIRSNNFRVTSGPRVVPMTSEIVPETPIASAQSSPPICSHGFKAGTSGQCIDVDKCQRSPNPCARSTPHKCVNTIGSFRYFFIYFMDYLEDQLQIGC